MQRKKICIVSGYFPLHRGGAEYQCYLISKFLKIDFYDVFYIATGGSKSGLYHYGDTRVYHLRSKKFLKTIGGRYLFLYFPEINKILRREMPSIVYQRIGSSYTGIFHWLSKRIGFKYIWASSHTRDFDRIKIQMKPNRMFLSIDELIKGYGIKNAKNILVQTKDQNDLLKRNFGKMNGCVLYNSHIFPDQLKCKKKENQVVWVANFKKDKNPDDFFKVVYLLRHKNIRFVMIGKCEASEYLEKIEKVAESTKNFKCYRDGLPLEKVNKIIEESLLLVNTSYSEGFPNTFIQAWMREVPVVSLFVDPDNLIEKNRIGLCAKGNVDTVCEYILKMIDNAEDAKIIGKKARIIANELFNIENNYKEFKKYIEALK